MSVRVFRPPRPAHGLLTRCPSDPATFLFLALGIHVLLASDVGFVDFRDPDSATIAKERFKGHELRGHVIGALYS